MIVSMGDADIPELTEPERAGWKALGSSYRALAEAAAKGDLTEEDVGATLAAHLGVEWHGAGRSLL